MGTDRYPLVRRLVRPVLAVGGCAAVAALAALAGYGSRLWLAIPLGAAGFVVAMLMPFLMRVGDTSPDDIHDRWGLLAASGPLLVFVSALVLVPPWYDGVTVRPIEAVVAADLPGGFDRPGPQLVRLKAADTGEELGDVWFHADHDLVAGDRVTAYADRLGWLRVRDGQGFESWTGAGYLLGVAGLAGLGALVAMQVPEDRLRYRRRVADAG
ncbi:hypothetical protein [Catellatospora sichuanensis]|uniref:hypothetical protein n=1 Tax=Catellatospora sichuanensis TaxID=1969805 RepID=UPI0011837640|nr:hypothetical protein [Catellatospora sichuanensis]